MDSDWTPPVGARLPAAKATPALDDHWQSWMERSGLQELLRLAKALRPRPSRAAALKVLRTALRALEGAALDGDPLAAADAFRIVMALLRIRERGIARWVERRTMALLPLAVRHVKRAPSGRHALWYTKRSADAADLRKFWAVRRARKGGLRGLPACRQAAAFRHEPSPDTVGKQYQAAFDRVKARLKRDDPAYTALVVALILKKYDVRRKVRKLIRR